MEFSIVRDLFIGLVLIVCLKGVYSQNTVSCGAGTILWPETQDTTIAITQCTVGPAGVAFTIDESTQFIYELDTDVADTYNVYFAANIKPDYETPALQSFVFTARASSGTPPDATAVVIIAVTDENDNNPFYVTSTVTDLIDENSVQDAVVTLQTVDFDLTDGFGAKSIVYTFTNDGADYDGTFQLVQSFSDDGKTSIATINVEKALDYETLISYSLEITATDEKGAGTSVFANAVINVKDVEDTAPYFQKVAPSTQISEDTAVGASVLQVTAVDGDKGINNPVVYDIIEGNDEDPALFKIDSATGLVTVNSALDRDFSLTGGVYTLTIQASEQTSNGISARDDILTSATTLCTISLIDVDDSKPTFSLEAYTASVPENSPNGFLVAFESFMTVTDADSGNNAKFTMAVTGDSSSLFSISPDNGQSQTMFTITVADSANLDYETIQSVDLTVTATDSGDPTLTSTAQVTISITDQNDLNPVITPPNCDPIPEDVAIDKVVCTIEATDGDSDLYNTIAYSASFGQLEGSLIIDRATGAITVTSNDGTTFDYEKSPTYSITVTATDDDGNGRVVSQTVTLDITDVNDNPPTFLQAAYQASLMEGDTAFSSPFLVQATDRDSYDINGNIMFQIDPDLPTEYFDLANNGTTDDGYYTAMIFPKSDINFETACSGSQTSCKLVFGVIVYDENNPDVLKAAAQVTVTLMDTNDEPPTFQLPGYEASIPEDASAGTSVTTVMATDADATNKYKSITYRLENDNAPNFVIDGVSGEVTVSSNAVLDPDAYAGEKYIYNLIVIADDGGSRDVPSQCFVNVTITDINNKNPAFTNNGIYTRTVVESDTQAINLVNATDLDQGSILSYSIDVESTQIYDKNGISTHSVDITEYLTMDSQTGVITIDQALDRETMSSVVLALVVTDTAATGDPQSDTGTLTITIEDVNDNAPVFATLQYSGSVMENSSNTMVTMEDNSKVTATDDDFNAQNKVITYSIISLDPEDADINIDATTGYLITGEVGPDYETSTQVIITIQATDSGDPPLSAAETTIATITVINKNEFPPVFDSLQYVFHADEKSYAFSDDAHVSATDADADTYGDIEYQLQENYDSFSIDNNGILTINNPLDYETSTQYVLTVYAVDHPGDDRVAHLSGNTLVTVIVGALNDMTPKFTDFKTELPVSETYYEYNGPTSSVYKFVATDADKDVGSPDATVDYGLYDDYGGLFSIDPSSGDLYVKSSLLNGDTSYDLNVTACDEGTNPGSLCTAGVVHITIQDVNDRPPYIIPPPDNNTIFYQSEYDPDNPDKTPNDRDVPLFTVNFKDDDPTLDYENSDFKLSCNCIATYGDNPQDIFYIRIKDGTDPFPTLEVYFHGTLLRSDCAYYQMTVTITNRENSYDDKVLSTSGYYRLSVEDIDNFPPEFDVESANTTFLENVADLEFPLPLPRDKDNMGNDTLDLIYCRILASTGSDAFDIISNGYNCTLVNVDPLDREYMSSYSLTVEAFENSSTIIPPPDDQSRLLVVVTVDDENDNTPEFIDSVFYGGVSSDTARDTIILNLTASDKDAVIDAHSLTYELTDGATGGMGMDDVPTDCIVVDKNTGALKTAFDFTEAMQGYITYTAVVYDSDRKHQNTAHIQVNVIIDSQKLECSSLLSPDYFDPKSDQFEEDFTAILNSDSVALKAGDTTYVVVIDSIKMHEENGETVAQYDIFFHVLKSNDVMEAEDAMGVINGHSQELYDTLFANYSIFYVGSVVPYVEEDKFGIEFYILIAIAGILLISCIVILGVCIYKNSKITRKLRAIQATSFIPGSTASGLNRMDMPINKTYEGSNPIYNMDMEVDVNEHKYEETSDTSEDASLQNIRNENDFQGGLNNPNFEQRIENIFSDENMLKSGDYSNAGRDDDAFDHKFSLPSENEPAFDYGTADIETLNSEQQTFESKLQMPEENSFETGFESISTGENEENKTTDEVFSYLNQEDTPGQDLY